MKAMVFAAGLGTRLRPLTDHKPKALVEVAGKPMIEHVLLKIIKAGINDIVVNVHHFSSQIVDFLSRNANFGADIIISDESDKLLDTGGGILAAREWLDGDEPILVHNADILTDFDIHGMEQAHAENKALATLLVKDRKTTRYFAFDESRRLRGWTNIATGERKPTDLALEGLDLYAFGGVHIISPEIFPLLQKYAEKRDSDVFSITPFYVEECDNHKICGYLPKEPYKWHDIGKPEALQAAELEF